MNEEKNLKNKKKLFIKIIKDVKTKKEFYLKNYNKYDRYVDIVDATTNFMNATAIILTISCLVSLNPGVLVGSAIVCGASFTLALIKRVLNWDKKRSSFQTSYIQYSELERDMLITLTNTNITAIEMDEAFRLVSEKLALMDDNRLPTDNPEDLSVETFLTFHTIEQKPEPQAESK